MLRRAERSGEYAASGEIIEVRVHPVQVITKTATKFETRSIAEPLINRSICTAILILNSCSFALISERPISGRNSRFLIRETLKGACGKSSAVPHWSPMLLDEVRWVMHVHHYSIHTERCYLDWFGWEVRA